MLNQMLLWVINAISTPNDRDSSFLKVDVTSHESLQQKQFYHEAVSRLMQYLVFFIII